MIDNIKDRVLFELFDHGIICNAYSNLILVERKIKYAELCREYNCKMKFKKLVKELISEGWLMTSGKRLDVISLTMNAVKYLKGKYF